METYLQKLCLKVARKGIKAFENVKNLKSPRSQALKREIKSYPLAKQF